MAEIVERTDVTAPVLAKRWGVGTDKVTGFIKSGELQAINIATKIGGRPRYLISEDAIAAFKKARQVVPDSPQVKRLRRKPAVGVKEFF
jgi:hypothetical protein